MNQTLATLGRAAAAGILLAVVGCASTPEGVTDDNNDPLEPVNRTVFDLNQSLDRAVMRPVAVGYNYAVPEGGRDAIRRALDNLKEPVNFINNLLQGDSSAAGATAARFAVNTAMGFGGFFDVATELQIDHHKADFGQTLYSWGVGDGPYLVLPLFGPSNLRDAVGLGVDSVADPTRYLFAAGSLEAASYGMFALDGVDQRAGAVDALDSLEKNALDYYALMRSLSRQRRATELEKDPQVRIDLQKSSLYDDPEQKKPASPPQTSVGH
jgi:phospholipid-binding lipoprotein MlaA